MKRYVLLLICLFSTSLMAQIGLKTGFNFTRLSSDQNHTKTNLILRYHIGISFKGFKLGENVRLKPELMLSWKGQRYKYDETFAIGTDERRIETDYKDKFTYLDWIWPVNFSLNEKIYMELGVFGGLRFGGKKKGETKVTDSGSFSQTDTFSEDAKYSDKDVFPDGEFGILSKRPVSPFDGGVSLGGGYKLSDKIGFSLRYQYGLVDIFRNNYPTENASKGFQGTQVLQLSTIINLGN